MCPYPYEQIEQYQQGVYEHYGKFVTILQPGFHYKNPFTSDIIVYDIRTKIQQLAKQIVITKDNISVCMDASIYYSISDIAKAKYRVNNLDKALNITGISALRVISAINTLQ